MEVSASACCTQQAEKCIFAKKNKTTQNKKQDAATCHCTVTLERKGTGLTEMCVQM